MIQPRRGSSNVVIMMVVAIIALADDLRDLKAASLRYFVAMKGALALFGLLGFLRDYCESERVCGG